jgi:hypothetical protein
VGKCFRLPKATSLTPWGAFFTFDEFEVVKPGVVVHRVRGDFLLILKFPLLDDDILDADPLAELLLVGRVVLVQLGAYVLRQAVQRKPVDGARSVVLLYSRRENASKRGCLEACTNRSVKSIGDVFSIEKFSIFSNRHFHR